LTKGLAGVCLELPTQSCIAARGRNAGSVLFECFVIVCGGIYFRAAGKTIAADLAVRRQRRTAIKSIDVSTI
jgi:hypothetical protein